MDKKEDMAALIHSLNNIVGIIESSINLLKHANVNTLGKRWVTMRDALIVTGRDRLDKEISTFRNVRNAEGSISMEIETDAYSKFLKANICYKSMFDILINSEEYSNETKISSFDYGNKTVNILKNIINSLEVKRIGLHKKQNFTY